MRILEADTIKQGEMKEKNKKEYSRRTRKLIETKLYIRNLIKGIINWTVPVVRYSGPFLKWTRDEIKQMNQRTKENKIEWLYIKHYIPDMMLTDYMCQEKKGEEDLPVLKIALLHQYNNLKTTYKSVEEDCLQPPETILTTWGLTEWQ